MDLSEIAPVPSENGGGMLVELYGFVGLCLGDVLTGLWWLWFEHTHHQSQGLMILKRAFFGADDVEEGE